MRPPSLLVLVLLLATAPRAQALYRAVGDTGFGLSAATTLNSDAANVVGSAILTLAPSVDLAVSAGRSTLGRRSVTTLGVLGTYWVQRSTPTRAGLRVGASHFDADGRTAVVVDLGAVVARQARVSPRALVVPSLTADVLYVVSDDFASGLQTSVSAGAALVIGGDGARAYVGPSATLNSETNRLAFGVGGGVLF